MAKTLKRTLCVALVVAVIVSVLAVQPSDALAAQNVFNFNSAAKGYVTVKYKHSNSKTRLKVGLKKQGQSKTYYYDIKSGKQATLPLQMGNGKYTATLYINKSGTTYKVGQKKTATVKIASSTKVYLNNITEISWTKKGKVAAQAKKLIKGKKTTKAKAMAIYSYIVKNFKYDTAKAKKVSAGKLAGYIPNTEAILKSKKGICYDIASLYAAMLRSVGIPAKMIKGTSKAVGGVYHAWNSVYDSSTKKWITMDLTVDMCKKRGATTSWRPVKTANYKTQYVY